MSFAAVVSNLAGDLLTVTLWMSRPDGVEGRPSRCCREEWRRVCVTSPMHLSLLEVKSQRDLGVLKVVVARARIRLVGPELARRREQEPDGHTKNRLATSID